MTVSDKVYSSEMVSQSRLSCGLNEWVEFGLENIGELSIKDRVIRGGKEFVEFRNTKVLDLSFMWLK